MRGRSNGSIASKSRDVGPGVAKLRSQAPRSIRAPRAAIIGPSFGFSQTSAEVFIGDENRRRKSPKKVVRRERARNNWLLSLVTSSIQGAAPMVKHRGLRLLVPFCLA